MGTTLVIASSIAPTSAAGIVFSQLVQGMEAAGGELIVCGSYQSGLDAQRNLDFILPFPDRSSRLAKLIYVVSGRDWFAVRWARTMLNRLRSQHALENITKLVCLLASPGHQSMELAALLKATLKVQLHAHFVDAIPNPLLWGEAGVLHKSKRKRIRRLLGDADSISAINDDMYHFQLDILGREGRAGDMIIGNPIVALDIPHGAGQSGRTHSGTKTLLFLGSLSPCRTAHALVGGFRTAKSAGLNVQLVFQGTNPILLPAYSGATPGQEDGLMCLPYTKEPQSALAQADVLVDLDVSSPGDVFTSGKLMTYLATDLPIIAITTKNSPTARLLADQRAGCWVVGHDSLSIARAISEACNFTDREAISRERMCLRNARHPKVLGEMLLAGDRQLSDA